jgi:cyclophilin family peptidyl-prolyl cis-trans isomerase
MFHRIDKGFVIQAGDNSTKFNGSSRDSWGTGGPSHSIKEEFTDIPHKRGIVSMARAADPKPGLNPLLFLLT